MDLHIIIAISNMPGMQVLCTAIQSFVNRNESAELYRHKPLKIVGSLIGWNFFFLLLSTNWMHRSYEFYTLLFM